MLKIEYCHPLRSVGWRRSSLSISMHIQDPEITSSYPLLVKGDKVLSFEFWVLSGTMLMTLFLIHLFLIEHNQHPPPAFAPLIPAPPSKEDFLFFTVNPVLNWKLNVPCWILNIAMHIQDPEITSSYPLLVNGGIVLSDEFWVLSGTMLVIVFLIPDWTQPTSSACIRSAHSGTSFKGGLSFLYRHPIPNS